MRFIHTQFAVNIGITGHRKITDEIHVKNQLKQVLLQIRTLVTQPKEFWNGFEGETVLRLMSCLADGTDQLAAEVALESGYALHALVPFPLDSEVHWRDRVNGKNSLPAFDNLLAQAEHKLFMSPHCNNKLDWNSEEAESQRHRGYKLSNERMLSHCDFLIAVWDGQFSPRICGTAQVVRHAQKKSIPIIWIHATENREPVILLGHDEKPLQEIFNFVFKKQDNREMISFETFYAEQDKEQQETIFSYGCCVGWLWKRLWLLTSVPRTDNHIQPIKPNEITPFYEDADYLASHYANCFRGAFLTACILGAAAITIAVSGLVLHEYATVLGVMELLVIGLLGHNFAQATKGRWQLKTTIYRYLAEQLRHFEILKDYGWVIPNIHTKLHSTQHYVQRGTWLRWYLRNIVRSAGLPNEDLSDETVQQQLKTKLSENWIADQANYHQRNYQRYKKLKHIIHQLTLILFAFTVIALVGHIILEFFHLHELPKWSLTMLGVLTVIFPVWAMSVHVMGHYAEVQRAIDRSKAMNEQLTELQKRMKNSQTVTELENIARETAYLMLQETADWHIQNQMTELGLA
jgi:hypothetical protein